MSTTLRKLIFMLIGLLGGLASWSVTEWVLFFQADFPDYLLFSMALGAIPGAIMGGFMGTTEGIGASVLSKLKTGIPTGILVGIPGGALGFLLSQGTLFFMGAILIQSQREFQEIAIPLARVLGWGFLGMFIGSVEGVRARSLPKIKIGFLGGFLGGVIGGVALETFNRYMPGLQFSRLIGFLILGSSIGLFYSLVESRFSQGILKLLNGPLKGKEYPLVQKKTRVGLGGKAEIELTDYKNIQELEALFRIKKDAIYLEKLGKDSLLKVNDREVEEHRLKLEDVIQVGSAKFLFLYR